MALAIEGSIGKESMRPTSLFVLSSRDSCKPGIVWPPTRQGMGLTSTARQGSRAHSCELWYTLSRGGEKGHRSRAASPAISPQGASADAKKVLLPGNPLKQARVRHDLALSGLSLPIGRESPLAGDTDAAPNSVLHAVAQPAVATWKLSSLEGQLR